MTEFNWTIETVDKDTQTMVVLYTQASSELRYNIPMPTAGHDVSDWISKFAPVNQWERLNSEVVECVPGLSGVGTVVAEPLPDSSDTANVIGNWNEEYLRAMIYQVLEEMREETL